MTDTDERPMYGVWLPGQGWLRTSDDLFADYNKELAEQVAQRVGQGAVVLFIDDAIIKLEEKYKENESRSIWQNFSNFFKRNDSK